MYEYKIKTVDHIVDGDTFDCSIDLGFNITHKIRVRMYGINTPESRTRDLEEKRYGLAAKARLREILESAESITIKTAIDKKARGKYGRILGTVYADDMNVNEKLLEEGHAIEYFGGKKQTNKWWKE